MPLALALALLAGAPSEAALADARTIAENGMLATIAGLQTTQEIDEMIAEHPELSEDERQTLRATGAATAKAMTERAIAAEAAAYAAHLSPEDLAAIAAFSTSDAARAQRTAMPLVMRDTMTALASGGPFDFAGTVRAEFCTKTGKLCETAPE